MNAREMLEYDEWATTRLLNSAQILSPEQFTREHAGKLSSVRQQFVHFLNAADRYRARLAGDAVPDADINSFASIDDLHEYKCGVYLRLSEYIVGLDEPDFDRELEHATRSGVYRATVSQTLWQVFNHATYHRGQIAMLLKLSDVDFADTDVILWLNRAAS